MQVFIIKQSYGEGNYSYRYSMLWKDQEREDLNAIQVARILKELSDQDDIEVVNVG